MRPIVLTMTAFGPYKDKETVDFTELGDHRLFVVSGNTGAGKTTIFDAICFALYGQASGDDRSEARMLRSHFAEDDVHTSVEFRFELKGRTYQVFRQLPHVKAGNKSETGERHELYEWMGDGRLTPLTDRQSKRPVDEKLLQLIGLTREQFSQIVMLPQGEFRKFLVSDTDNKEKILRNIFRTGLFKIVEDELDGRRKSAKQELEERLNVRAVFIHSLTPLLEVHVAERERASSGLAAADSGDVPSEGASGGDDAHPDRAPAEGGYASPEEAETRPPGRAQSPLIAVLEQEHHNVYQVLSGLDREIEAVGEEVRRRQAALQAEGESLKLHAEEVHRARALEDKFRELEAAAARRQSLEERMPAFEAKRRECDAAKQAKHIRVYDEHAEGMRRELEALRAGLREAEEEAARAETALKQADDAYRREEGNADMREQWIRELSRLQSFLPAAEAMERSRETASRLARDVEDTAQAVRETERQWADVQARKAELLAVVKAAEARMSAYPDKAERLAAMREQAKLLGEHIKLEEEARGAAHESEQARVRFEEAAAAYAAAEKRWFDGQASVLAEHLHDGEPCPVCGSVSHPVKASFDGAAPTRQQLDELRIRRAELEKRFLAAAARQQHAERQLAAARDSLTRAGVEAAAAAARYADMVAEGKRLAEEVAALKAEQATLAERRSELEACEANADGLARRRERHTLRLHELQAALDKEQALLEQRVRDIPDALRSLAALTAAIAETERRKRESDAAWQEAQANARQARERYLAAAQHAGHLFKQETDAAGKLAKAKESLEAALTSAGFADVQAYRAASRTDADIAAMERDIEAFRRELELARSQHDHLQAYLLDKSRPDLDELDARLRELERQTEASRQRLIRMQTLADKLAEIRDNIEYADAQVKEAEARYGRIKELYDTIRGDNPSKISFERYLQIEFLEQIIEAANRRLQQLSNGQYVLVRSERMESRGKQSGLSLDVFDHYTGQYRDVKTLSGGEKFNASLCLALGMADVIQSYQGGVSIETMLIDEGFGSLDEDSLHKAIETLIDLQQSGRLVGIISHVAELKQAIPAILEVTKTKEGYSRTRFAVV